MIMSGKIQKPEYKIILCALVMGLFFWLADTALDWCLFHGGSLRELVEAPVLGVERWVRFGALAAFLVFCGSLAVLLSQRVRAGKKIRHLTLVLSAIRDVNRLITEETDSERMIQGACEILTRPPGYFSARIVLTQPENEKIMALGQFSGGIGSFCQNGSEKRELSSCFSEVPADDQVRVVEEKTKDCPGCFLAAQATRASCLSARLAHKGETFGVLTVSVQKDFAGDAEELKLFRELADDIAFALHKISSEERQRLQALILDEIRDQVAVTDLKGRIVYVNQQNSRTLGINPEDMLGRSVEVFGDDPSRGATQKEIVGKTIRDGEWQGEVVNFAADGSELIMDCRTWVIHDRDGRPKYLGGVSRNITERKQMEVALQEREASLRRAQKIARMGSWELDFNNQKVIVSDETRKIYGFGTKDWSIEESKKIPLPEYRKMLDKAMEDLIAGRRSYEVDFQIRRPTDGKIIDIHSIAEYDAERNVMMGTMQDVTEQKKLQEKMAFFACHDPLTGLANRSWLEERFKEEASRAERNATKLAIILIDIDRFQLVNDTLGHPSGDRLLLQVAVRLKNIVRKSDFVCRPGGDEFLVMLSDLKNLNRIGTLVKKIQSLFHEPFQLEGQFFKLTATMGISIFPDDGGDIHQLFKNSENAMYHAKGMGRNTFKFFKEEMNVKVQNRLELENGLRDALSKEELSLAYQPQIDLLTGRIVGAEALLRWSNPKLGLVSPTQFIPVAEETGLIVPIGDWVMEEACRQLSAWRLKGMEKLALAVNLSGAQLFENNFLQSVSRKMDTYGIDRNSLAFELTETVFLEDHEVLQGRLFALKDLGVEFVLDDFGTGYSSLSYLKRFRIDKLKIDKSFVRDICRDPNDQVLVKTMIQMAHNLGIKVVAEGVETKEQMVFLAREGCESYQGYLCSQALAAEDFETFYWTMCGCSQPDLRGF